MVQESEVTCHTLEQVDTGWTSVDEELPCGPLDTFLKFDTELTTRGLYPAVDYYYHINGHGDVTALTDASGNIVAQYQYDAWCNILSQSGTMASTNPYRYAGYRYDEATGLYYLMARYYDANIGRIITRDTFHGFENSPISLNQYAYTYNNPIIYKDSNGHFVFLIPLAGLAFGALVEAAVVATLVSITIVAAYEVSKALEDKFKRKKLQ